MNKLPVAPIQDERGILCFSLEGRSYTLNVNGYFPEIYEVSIQNLFHGCNSLKLLKVNKHFQKSYKMHLSYDVEIEIV